VLPISEQMLYTTHNTPNTFVNCFAYCHSTGKALKANITTLGPLVLPISEQMLFAAYLLGPKLLGKKKLRPYIPDFIKRTSSQLRAHRFVCCCCPLTGAALKANAIMLGPLAQHQTQLLAQPLLQTYVDCFVSCC
jgi:hypothetical protein